MGWAELANLALGPGRDGFVDQRSPADRPVGVGEGVGVRRDRSGVEFGETGEWLSGFAASSAMDRQRSRKDGSMLGRLDIETVRRVSPEDRSNETKLRAYFGTVRK